MKIQIFNKKTNSTQSIPNWTHVGWVENFSTWQGLGGLKKILQPDLYAHP